MRRLLSFAAFAVFLALIPAQGERHAGGGGGRAMTSAGHAGGFTARGSSGHASGPRRGGFAAPRGRSGPGHSFRSSFRQPGFHQPDRGGSRDGRRGFRARDFRFQHGFRDCFGCRRWRGYPWWYAGYYDPYWGWDSSSYDYDEDHERQLALAEEMDQRSLERQRVLDQQDQDPYALPSASSSRAPASDNETHGPSQATVLVFRDQRREEVQNYAIVGQTLWIFSPLRTEKIPLAEIDLAASAKANEDRGVEFRLPGTAEGQ
jgi:hypothetical protein